MGTIFTLMPLGVENLNRAASTDFLRIITWSIVMTFFYGWIGLYLIKNGGLLFVILNCAEPPPTLKDLKKS